jgi:hypothetical protein
MTTPDSPPAQTPVPWARQPSTSTSRKTTRTRKTVTTLPAWDPMPPGEIVVRRPDPR